MARRCVHVQCTKPAKARRLCTAHYAELRRRGARAIEESDARVVAREAQRRNVLCENGVLISGWDEARERRAIQKAIAMGLI